MVMLGCSDLKAAAAVDAPEDERDGEYDDDNQDAADEEGSERTVQRIWVC